MIRIIPITKKEAFELRSIVGAQYIKQSRSRKPHYYLVESKWAMDKYKEFMDNRILKTVV